MTKWNHFNTKPMIVVTDVSKVDLGVGWVWEGVNDFRSVRCMGSLNLI
jgi:hypothetical protein